MTAAVSARPRTNLTVAIVAGSFIAAVALGVRATFGLFLDPIAESLNTGRGAISFAIAVQQLAWGVSQPFGGAIADRFGTGRVLAAGGALYATAILLMSQATSPTAFVITGGFMVGVATGGASFAVILSAVGRMASPERRSMALGIVSAMGSVGQFFLIPLTRRLLDDIDWRQTSVVLGIGVLSIVLFTPALRGSALDQQNEADRSTLPPVPLRKELRRAASSRSFLLLNAAFFVCGFHVTFIATHLSPYATDVGLLESSASNALALVGLFNVAGSLLAGFLGGRHSKTKLLAGIYGLRGLVIGAYILVPVSGATTLAFGAAMGILWLSTVPLTSGIVASQFGTAHSGTLFGIVFLSHQFGAFLGAWMGGAVSDAAGSYLPVWWIAIALGLFAMVLHLLIDEGPVPEPPAGSHVPVGLAPAGGMAAVIVVAGITGAVAPALAAADADTEAHSQPVICVLSS